MCALCIYDFFDFCGRNMRCSRGELRRRSLLSGRLLAKKKMAQEVSNKPQDRLLAEEMMTEVVGIVGRKLKVVCDPSKHLFPSGFGVLTFHLAQATGTLICQYDVRMFFCVTPTLLFVRLLVLVIVRWIIQPSDRRVLHISTQVSRLFHFPHFLMSS